MFYIVRQGERIEDIASKYNCDVRDLRAFNTHITNFDNLHPGMRLTIPVVTHSVKDEMEYATPLVEEYYETQQEPTEQKVEQNQERPYEYNYSYQGGTNMPNTMPYPPVQPPMPQYPPIQQMPQYPQYPMYQQPMYPYYPQQPYYPQPCCGRPQQQPYYYQQNQMYYY